jgi:hypothetical protein
MWSGFSSARADSAMQEEILLCFTERACARILASDYFKNSIR